MDTYQETILKLKRYWSDRGAILQEPHDIEVGAGTNAPETFLRVLGPKPYRVGYVQPSRRTADGRYGENPNRLYKHHQFQLILKPSPDDVLDQYLGSLQAIGIDLKKHDIKFEEDNWEAPTLGAWGVGWQVLMDGMEITQFTYFQQAGGIDLAPITAEITYGLERIAMFLNKLDSVFDVPWSADVRYGAVRHRDEVELSRYAFEVADGELNSLLFDRSEKEARRCLEAGLVLPAYEATLACSHAFNMLDARGAVSATDRVGLIRRVRDLACACARAYVARESVPAAAPESEPAPASTR
jgi:glycyl-tRNA synthetase alpha chain